jgi:DNA-binding MarR family transcriptional regulator
VKIHLDVKRFGGKMVTGRMNREERAMEDEVDRLVAGWRQALPGIDVSPLEVLSRVTRLARHLDRQRTSVLARHDLEIWTFDVLAALRRSGPPRQLSPGQLVAQTLVTSGTMTNRLDHLEQRGLVRRLPDPTDARSVRVQLTAAGRRRVDGALTELVTREDAILATLDGEARATLAGLLRRVVAPFDA